MKSENINELAIALAKAQSKFKSAEEDKINPHFKSKYSSLNALWTACREGLTENGLSVIQIMDGEENLKLITILAHSSGQWIQSVLPIASQRITPQALGSAITYMKRYSLSAIVGISSGDEDDGNAAQMLSDKPTNSVPNNKYLVGAEKFIDENEFDTVGSAGYRFLKEVCDRSGKSKIETVNSMLTHPQRFQKSFSEWKEKND